MARAEVTIPAQLPALNERMNRHQRRTAEARARLERAIPRRALTITEFCFAHGFSRATYYNLKACGEGPAEMRVLGKVLITEAAAAKWRKQTAARSNTKQNGRRASKSGRPETCGEEPLTISAEFAK